MSTTIRLWRRKELYMSNQDEGRVAYRAHGGRLGVFINAHPGIPKEMQGRIRDFAEGNQMHVRFPRPKNGSGPLLTFKPHKRGGMTLPPEERAKLVVNHFQSVLEGAVLAENVLSPELIPVPAAA